MIRALQFIGVMILASCFSIAYAAPKAPSLYQVSTSSALLNGLFEGTVSFNTLEKHGDFGLGSVADMNGELIAFNGKFYRIAPDGKMNIIPKSQTTPYAVVTFFHPTIHFNISNVKNYAQLVKILNQHITNRNIPYAINIQGKFNQVKLRAVRGAKPPYPPFSELAKGQAIFDLTNVNGDGVGFFFPPYLSKVNTPGYHIHFITANRKTGGHILELNLQKAKVSLMPIYNWTIRFPQTKAYANNKNLDKDFTPLLKKSFGPGVQLK